MMKNRHLSKAVANQIQVNYATHVVLLKKI